MSGERDAFMTAILANPDDDTPRLVFADWLDENGTEEDQAHAALIRAQCRTEILPKGSTERRKLEREAKAILDQYGDHWLQPLADASVVDGCNFRRGFVDGLEMSATEFVENAEKIFAAAPTIRSARFPDASNEIGGLAKCKYLARLASVDIREMCECGFCPIHNDLRALFNSKHAKSLTNLNIAGNRMDAEGAKRLAKSSALSRLTVLDVSDNPLGNEGVAELGESKHLKQLVSLNLSETGLDAEGVEAIAAFKNMPALRNLVLFRVSTPALKKFVTSPLFAQLTSLDLSGNTFGDAGARVLAAVPRTAKLETLTVVHCKIGAKGKALLKKRFGKGVKM
jgi:uncharacterized protein (TIGR02996 family)